MASNGVVRPLGSGGRHGQPSVKKLVIKNLSVSPRLPADFEAVTWAKLREAVRAIFSRRASGSLEELYQCVRDMCTHKLAKKLYESLCEECYTYAVSVLGEITGRGDVSGAAASFLPMIDERWQNFCKQIGMVRNVFLHLDRTYALQTAGVVSLWDMAVGYWRDIVVSNARVQNWLVLGLLGQIELERRGDAVDRSVVRNLLRMLSSLHIYDAVFEVPFLSGTQQFYQIEGQERMASLNVPDYLAHVEARLASEAERAATYLDVSTRAPLLASVEEHLIRVHVVSLLERGFVLLMDERRTPDLARLYSLLSRIGALADLRQHFQAFVKLRGLAMVKNADKDATLITELIAMKQMLDAFVHTAFADNEKFQTATKDAYESFINVRENKPAELIAKFIDSKLRMGNKELGEEELEAVLDDAIVMFRFIHGKDVFEAFYKKDLAKRLLYGKSASVDAELMMLSKLKSECGGGFTLKLEGMFKDIGTSRDLMASFQASRSAIDATHGIELSVNVLTQGYWPTYPPVSVHIPDDMSACQVAFQEFYLRIHTGRRLTWQNSLGDCVIKARLAKGTKELVVAMYQALVLLLLNGPRDMQLSFCQIQETTNIASDELRRTLQSLACGKIDTRVLAKQPKGRDVADDDLFSVNQDFKNPRVKIKINQVMLKETPEENSNTREKVFQDRQYQVDAAIVRIMKTRKKLSHTLLISELFEQLKFPIKPSDLKKRIESLMDREYLERDPNNSSVYIYLA